jgi:hypothetical protein
MQGHAMKKGLMLVLGCFLMVPTISSAQAVYKCVSKGSVVYSHEPCVGATVVDTTPTQGLDKWTGQSRKSTDVVRTEQNKAFADALKPLLNETPEQRDKRHRRAKLAPAERLECEKLDPAIEAGAGASGLKPGAPAGPSEQELFEKRRRYRELRC